MGANDFRSALADVRAQETCFHGRHIDPQIYAGLTSADGWTLIGAPGNLSAQYEHTMIITRGEPIVVTRH